MVGQSAAKRAVAIALRNRMRRQKLPPDLADDIMPKNIIMIGPTGVGKTEIARRLAKLTGLAVPEGGGVEVHRGRVCGARCGVDVRDLVEIAIDMVREEKPGRRGGQGGAERRGAAAGLAAASRRAAAREARRRKTDSKVHRASCAGRRATQNVEDAEGSERQPQSADAREAAAAVPRGQAG